MATDETVTKLEETIKEILEFDTEELRENDEWGKLNFHEWEPDFERIFVIANHLKLLPLRFLPETTATTITQNIRQTIAPLKNISEFDIDTSNPSSTRTSHGNAIKAVANNIYTQVTPWIPFLAYQKGDVAKNISALTRSVAAGRELVEVAKKNIASSQKEIAVIVEKTREASASAGAAVFTKQFDKESSLHSSSATRWLIATGVVLLLTIGVGLGIVFWGGKVESIWEAGPRFFVLAALLTTTLWCAKMYKTFMHLSTINRHRALSLQTFEAFSAAASDEQTKNAVLLETTRAIFGPSSSGFLGGKGSSGDAGTRVVEIMKTVGGK